MGGLIGFLAGFCYQAASLELVVALVLSMLIAGLVMSARLALEVHTLGQVFLGKGIGVLICLGMSLLTL